MQEFTYLGSTITSNIYIPVDLNKRIGNAASVTSRRSLSVWENDLLTENTKVRVYQHCVLSTRLYGSETWTTYAKQEKRINTFHLRCLSRILGINWQEHKPNKDVFDRADIPSMFALLNLRWLGLVCRIENGRIPKDILCGELASGARRDGRPSVRFRAACKRDIKSAQISIESRESTAADSNNCRHAV